MLKEFLVKAAYTTWVRTDKPEITNSDRLFKPASRDALAKLKFDAALNSVKRTDPRQYEYLMNLPSNIYTAETFMNPAQKNLARLEREHTARLNDSIRTSANALLNRINPNYSVKPPFAGIKPATPKLDPTVVQVRLPNAIKNTTIEPTSIDSLVANADLNGIQLASSPRSTAGIVDLGNLPDFNPNDSLQNGTYIPPVEDYVVAPDGNTPKPAHQDFINAPDISTEQARQLLARGITPTSIGGYTQFLGSDGSNPQANGFIERMNADPNYNPFANIKKKYVDKLQGALVDPSYDPQVIRQRNINAATGQAGRDADRRVRIQAAQQMAAQGNTGAQDYLNYMQSGKPMTVAGQQFIDNHNITARQLQHRRQQTAKPFVRVDKWNSVLDGPRPTGENAAMRKALGYPDTGYGAGSHAAADKWIAKNNVENGV